MHRKWEKYQSVCMTNSSVEFTNNESNKMNVQVQETHILGL